MNNLEKGKLKEIKMMIEALVGPPLTIEVSGEVEGVPEGMMDPDFFLNLLEYNLKQEKMNDHSFVNLFRSTLPLVHFERSGKNKKGKK